MSDNFFDELEQEIAGDIGTLSEVRPIVKQEPTRVVTTPRNQIKSNKPETRSIISETLDSTPMFAEVAVKPKAQRPFSEERPREKADRKNVKPRSERSARSEKTDRMDSRYEESLQQHSYTTLHEPRPVFLPSIKPGVTRIMPVSLSEKCAPAMSLYQYQDEILLVNLWIEESGSDMFGAKYALPDIRFLASQKDKVKAIVLTTAASIAAPAFKHILAYLNFPKIYAPDFVIEKLKSSIRNGGLFDRCRFVPISQKTVIGGFVLSMEVSHDTVAAVSIASPSVNLLQILDPSATISGSYDAVVMHGGKYDPSPLMQASGVKNWAVMYAKQPATELSWAENFFSLEGGSILELEPNKEVVQGMKLFLDSILLDGHGIGTASSHVIKARAQMMASGVITLVFIVDKNSKTILGPIKIETRGLAYLHEAREIHRFIIKTGKNSYEQTIQDIPDIEEKDLIKIIKKDLEQVLSHKIGRSPMIIPVVINV